MKPMRGLLSITPLLGLLTGLSAPVSAQQAFSLPELLSLAERSNPGLRAAQAGAEAAEAAWRGARLLPPPHFEFGTGSGSSWDGTVRRTTRSLGLTQGGWMPPVWSARTATARLDRDIARLSAAEELLELRYQVSAHYFQVLYLQERTAVARRTLEALRRTEQLVAARARLGEVRELEALKLRVEALRAESQLADAEGALASAREHLDAYLGGLLPDGFLLTGTLTALPEAPDLESLRTRLRRDRPAVSASAARLEQARRILTGQRWSRLLPDITLTLFRDEGLDGRVSGVGLSVPLPLWDLRTQSIRGALAEVTRREEEHQALLLELETGLADQLRRLELAGRRLELFQEGLLDQAEAAQAVAEAAYREGELSLIDYLDSRRTYDSVLSDYQASLFEWNLERAALERAIGGEG